MVVFLATNLTIVLSANNPDVVDKLEGLVALWSKVIEQVLAESEQVGCKLCLPKLLNYLILILTWLTAQDSQLRALA